jgi:Ser-tRNA(Ala) deacylase AlaX
MAEKNKADMPQIQPVERNELLEALSEMVRKGEPVNIHEAIAVAEYQSRFQQAREAKKTQTLWGRFLAFFNHQK